ncbi:hypothetical protein LMH87_002236 [Akanthomyces muscarius]|uniref:Zinc finger PHD-type domain-containing protein n=1 Tax=Akanthomyces muscarius TaxID=2231603 RepID=A0A9W8UJ71_AKAMU|nr:hypothetical protein LMH87_002236 [Akanthomyces muscarius]KAJ4147729.1 hypothetical protein LMH87_002236 [Akanthomyces muscarius]
MAPPSPRRSSRARAAHPQSQQSSSSGVSVRSERNTRSLQRPSSDKSTPSASLSSEPLEDLEEGPMPRRRRRGLDDGPEKALQSGIMDGMANASDDMQDEEDEAVRCICGSEDYPGRPPVDGPDAELFASVDLTAEDVTGFFVQCDICKVWQHGACVGIFSAESSPDEYFCEQCRQDLHHITIANNGQPYSKYLPLHRQSRPTSRATSVLKEGAKSPKLSSKASRAELALQASKRRSTMNSRDAAYDDEQLLRAIEASREEAPQDTEAGSRRAKRGRSDSEENQASVKRQRTTSRSASPAMELVADHSRDGSDDDTSTRSGAKKSRSQRSTKEKLEKDEKERQRQESANKRNNRAERRRAEDSDISEEMSLAPAKSAAPKDSEPPSASEPPPTLANAPGTPPPTGTAISSSHKRTSKSNQKRIRGKNQYTKDRDENEESPARSVSRDIQRTAEDSHPKSPSSDTRQSSKSKSAAASKMTMLDMKRRVAAIMEFISRTQVDLAAEAAYQTSSSSGEASPEKASVDARSSAKGSSGALKGESADDSVTDKEFRDLTCVEMMDVLTRDMVRWQYHYT